MKHEPPLGTVEGSLGMPRKVLILRIEASRPCAVSFLRVNADLGVSHDAVVRVVRERIAELEQLKLALNPVE